MDIGNVHCIAFSIFIYRMRTNGEGKRSGQPANPGSRGHWPLK